MRGLRVLLVMMVVLPTASATSLGAGVVDASVDAEPVHHCTVGIDSQTCVLVWDRGSDPNDLGDDNITATRFANSVRIVVTLPGDGPSQKVVLNTADLSLEHPGNRLLNETWIAANGSRPEMISDQVAFESRPFNTGESNPPSGLILHVRTPISIDDPGGSGHSLGDITPGIYSWDCAYYFTIQDETWCSYDSVHPFPSGVWTFGTTDETAEAPAYLLSCSNLHNGTEYVPQAYCPATNATADVAGDAAVVWAKDTPDLGVGGSVDKVVVKVRSDHERRSLVSEGAERAASIEAIAGEPAVMTRSSPEGTMADSSDGRYMAPLRGTDRAPPPGPSGQVTTALVDTATPSKIPWVPFVVIGVAVGGALLAVFFALYYRPVKREEILENPNRLQIYEAIRDEPGIRAGTLRNKLGVNYRTISFHLRALEQAHLVEGFGTPQRHYFVKGGTLGTTEKRKVVAVSTSIAKAICECVQAHGEISVSTVAEALGIPLSTASETISRLEGSGILRKSRTAQGVLVSVATSSQKSRDDIASYAPA